jgi:hypothetical protein
LANCKDVAAFLSQVQSRNVSTRLPEPDLAELERLSLIRLVAADQFQQLSQEIQGLVPTQQVIARETAQRAQLATQVRDESRKTHSILFHLEGQEKRQAETAKESQDEAALRSLDADLSARERQFADLMAKRSMLDTLTPFDGRYVALTGVGALALRDLGVRLYRVSDLDFRSYWTQSQQVEGELEGIAAQSASYMGGLVPALPQVDRSYLWAISIGLAKSGGDPGMRAGTFLRSYSQIGRLTPNEENRLMAAEILTAANRPLTETLPAIAQLAEAARKLRVPNESALGVGAILLMGQRGDGTFATDTLPRFLQMTRSYESAALLAVVNRPFDELSGRFNSMRSTFGGWGFQPSEDVELSSAYLAVSDLPLEGVTGKLAILTRGMAMYLQYPLVAASILAAVPVLEANETLSLLERAYEIIGQRTGPMSQAELICLAVRMVHGIKIASVDELDTTARAAPAATAARPTGFYYPRGPGFFFLPLIVTHGAYYSTFSGVGGVHPGHVHAVGGFAG